MTESLISTAVIFFLIMDPLGNIPLFMSVLAMRMRDAGGMEKGMVNLHAFKASILGEVGLVVLIVSGLGMAALMPGLISYDLFWSKMVMIALLTVFLAMLRSTAGRITRGEVNLATKMPFLGSMVLALWLIVLVTSVLAFG